MLGFLVRRPPAVVTDAIGRPKASALRPYRLLTSTVFDTYHPEQHYMRGPGPKWREKHAGDPPAGDAPVRPSGDPAAGIAGAPAL